MMEAIDTALVTNTDIANYHKKLFPWMHQGNDDDWCEEQLHRLITLTENSDIKFLLQAQVDKFLNTNLGNLSIGKLIELYLNKKLAKVADDQELSLAVCHSITSCGVYSNPNTLKKQVRAYLKEASCHKVELLKP